MVDRARKYIEITVDAAQAIRDLNRIEKSTATTAKSIGFLEGSVRTLSRTIGALAGFSLANEFIQLADAAVEVEAKLGAVVEEAEDTTIVFNDIKGIAKATGSDVESLSSVFQRLATAIPSAQYDDLLGTLDLVSTTLATTGVAAQGANATLVQLAQGLGAGVLQGDEFRTVNEQIPVLLRAWQEAAGRTGEALKDLSAAGFFTTESFIELRPQIEEITKRMTGLEQPPLTIARAFNAFKVELLGVFRELTSQQGSNAFGLLAENVKAAAGEVNRLTPFISTLGSTLVGIIEIFKELGTVAGESLGGLGVALSEGIAGLRGTLSDSRVDIEDYGDFWGYVWEVRFPGAVFASAKAIEVIWTGIKDAAVVAVAAIVNAWETVPNQIEKALLLVVQVAVAWGKRIAGIGLRVGNAFAENFVGGLNSIIRGFNALVPDIASGLRLDQVVFTPAGAATLEKFDQAIAGISSRITDLNTEISVSDDKFGSLTDEVLKNTDATILASAAELDRFQKRLEENRLQRETNRLLDEDVKLKNRSAEAAKKNAEESAKGSGAAAKAARQLERDRLAAAKALATGTSEVEAYLQALRDEIELSKLSTKERELREVAIELEKNAVEALTKATVAEQKGLLQLAEAQRANAAAWRDAIPAAQQLTRELQKTRITGEEVAETLGDAFRSTLSGILDGTESFADSMVGIFDSMLDRLLDKLIVSPLVDALSSLFGGFLGGGGLGSLFGGSTTLALAGTGSGGMVTSGGGVTPATGGAPMFATRSSLPSSSYPLSQLTTYEVTEGGGAPVTVNVIENPDKGGQRETRQGAQGETIVDVFVAQLKADIADDIGGGGGAVSGALERTYGLNRMTGAY